MSQRDPALESLLQSLRGCHEPAPDDRHRVRAALDDVLVEASVGPVRLHGAESHDGCCEEESSGVHSKPGVDRVHRPWGSGRRYHFGPSHLLVGALALAAAAAVAVVALARPGALGTALVALGEAPSNESALPASPSGLLAEPVVLGRAASPALLESDPVDDEHEFDQGFAPACEQWPCLTSQPERTLALAGATLEPEAAARASHVTGARASFAPRDEEGLTTRAARSRIEVTPAVAFDVTGGRVSPGVGLRVAAAVTKKREIAVQATAQRFEADAESGDSLWVLGSGVCWNSMQRKVDVSLCGTLGYERGRAAAVPRDTWRVTAGAEAHAVWNMTHAAGVYLAFQTVAPVIGDRPSDRAFSMRVMAGPEFRF